MAGKCIFSIQSGNFYYKLQSKVYDISICCILCRNAGLGLALLFMTVLGFDNITYGYVLTQGIPEFAVGIMVASNALLGVAGSAVYPYIKR